jgi:hypothetical protein
MAVDRPEPNGEQWAANLLLGAFDKTHLVREKALSALANRLEG